MSKMKQFGALFSALLIASAVTACNQNTSAENTEETLEAVTEEVTETEAPKATEPPADVLSIAQQGMFSSGGIITSAVSGDYDPSKAGKMNPELEIPLMLTMQMYYIRFLQMIMEIR